MVCLGPSEDGYALDVVRHREGVERPQPAEPPARVTRHPHVPSQRRRLAGHVADESRLGGENRADHRGPGARPRRVEHDQIGADPVGGQAADGRGRHLVGPHLGADWTDRSQVGPRIRRRLPRSFDGDDPPGRPDGFGEQRGEQARSGVEIEDHVTRLGPKPGKNRRGECGRRGRMYLPEPSRVDLEVVPAHVMPQPGRAVDHFHAVGTTPRPTTTSRRLTVAEQRRRPVAALDRRDLAVAGPASAQRQMITDAGHADRAGVHPLDVV